VRPHERTLAGPKADRLKILRATRTNLSSVFLLYDDRASALEPVFEAALASEEVVEARDDAGITHRLSPLRDPGGVGTVQRFLAARPVVIADGHHRYETALAYRDEQAGNERARYVLAYLANMEEEGVVVLPTHRLVRPPLPLAADALAARLAASFACEPLSGKRRAGEIDLVLPDRCLRLRPEAAAAATLADLPPALRALDVELLERAILRPLLGLTPEELDFTHDDDEATEAVTSGRAAAAFLLNPPSLAAVRDVCLAGEVMPQKSTYFYPKLASGLVLSLIGPPWV
jgi:uncharacterized protein (DUF1015 family)